MADTSSIVERSAAQRQPQPGEPKCVICGRYGEYVCDATDEDVCSLECRDVCISRHKRKIQENQQQIRRSEELRRKLDINISSGSADSEAVNQWPIPFVDFGQGTQLPRELLTNLTINDFERPTPVQMQTIPCVLEGHNVLVSAPTGAGKTVSYLIPAIAQILLAWEGEKEKIVALVLAPVRELAIQIETVAKLLMRGIADMKTALLVGGFPVPTQRYRLQGGVQLIVATPGRFLDILTNYSDDNAILPMIRSCVVDEVDVMLDVGFLPQISQIVALLATSEGDGCKHVQMLFFSATISEEVELLVRQVLKVQDEQAYTRIAVSGDANTRKPSYSLNPSVQQQVRWSEDKAKKDELFAFLKGKGEESTLVFVRSKIGAAMLAEAIEKRCGIGAAAIHAEKTQQERLRLLEAFVNLEIPVLVSTNVLSRGMDLLNVENVAVYDFPKKITDYVHLIGRVGRGGDDVSGNALTLLNLEDRPLFKELVLLLRQAKVSVPREVYQSIHSENAKKRSHLSEVVIDDSKRAFRIRKQLVDEIGAQASEWKEWNSHTNKRWKARP